MAKASMTTTTSRTKKNGNSKGTVSKKMVAAAYGGDGISIADMKKIRAEHQSIMNKTGGMSNGNGKSKGTAATGKSIGRGKTRTPK